MIKEAYCSFEVAKLLKEKGFNEMTELAYELEDGHIRNDLPVSYWRNSEIGKYKFSCPTHQMAMAWLREHGFHINVVISYDYSVDADENEVDRWTFWFFEILSSFSGNLIYTEEVNQYDSYEEAVEAALEYCLENLI